MPAEPYFCRADDGDERFCIFHPTTSSPPKALVLHVHAFAEEMNKSRRMAALQARALADHGLAVLQFDLLGCGDSAGEFGDATWARWLADVAWAADHLRHRAGTAGTPLSLWLWGHRVGALLATQAAAALAERTGRPPNLLLWQPTGTGKAALQQFLRIKAAAQLLEGGSKGVTESLKRDLAAGQPVEVAGYELHPEMAAGLEAATLNPPRQPAQAVWLEVTQPQTKAALPELLPASRAALKRWQAAGWAVDATALTGPAFWQTAEIEDAPMLVEHGTHALAMGS